MHKDTMFKGKNSLYNTVKVCSKIIGIRKRDLRSLWERQVVKKASRPDHILSSDFILTPSGRRFTLVTTNRLSKSFSPSAIRLDISMWNE